MSNISNKLEQISKNWEDFKQQNDARLNQIESKNSADPITLHQLNKISDTIDRYNAQLNFATAGSRPLSSIANEEYAFNNSETKYQKAFCNYVRKGVEGGIESCSTGVCSIGRNDAGYSITNRMSEFITSAIKEASIMRSICNVIQVSSDSVDLLDVDKGGIIAGWSENILTQSDAAQPLQVNKKTIATHQLYAQPKATQKLVDDQCIDIEMWLSQSLSDIFAEQENNAFIKGDGNGKPRGILLGMNNNNTINSQNQINKNELDKLKLHSAINDEDIMKLFYSLPNTYLKDAKFIVSRDAMQQIRMLKESGTGRYLWQPDFANKMSSTLLGHDIYIAADMPNISEGYSAIMFGDFKRGYQIVDRHDIRILRDPFTHKPFIKFYATKTVGGDIMNENAIRFLKTVKQP
jgi:HK97 family phage major capsid protein